MKSHTFLKQIVGKKIDEIYQVDYNNDKNDDDYLPWTFFLTFSELNKFMEIEGDFDGDHIRVNLHELSKLKSRLIKNDMKNMPDLWQVYEVKESETLGKLINKAILKCEFGIEKEEFEINENRIKGQVDVLTFVRLYYDKSFLTIFEGGCGLFVSDDPNIKLNFEESFDTYLTE